MPDITLSWVPYAIGQSVGAYPRRSELMLDDQPPPMQPVVGSAVVAADKTLAFVGLDPGEYWAVAPVGARFQYVSFEVEEPPPAQGPPGPQGPTGPPGPAIDVIELDYTLNATVGPVPAGGQLRLDNADPTVATKLYYADVDAPGVDQSRQLLAGVRITRIDVQDKNDATRHVVYDVHGRIDQAGYVELAVTVRESAGALAFGQRTISTIGREFNV